MNRSLWIVVLACCALPLSTLAQQPQFGGATSGTFTVGSFSSFEITATGTPTPYISYDNSLPNGLSFSNGTGSATLSGTPNTGSGGFYSIIINASNGVEPDATEGFDITINELATFTSADHATFVVGTNGQFNITTAGGYPIPVVNRCCTLPGGLNYLDNGDGTAKVYGTASPGTGGIYPFSWSAINDAGETSQDFTLEVDEAPAITSPNNITFHEDIGASFTVTATGFPAPILSKSGTLPNGITFDPATGALSGTAAFGTAGIYPITFTATNGVGTNASQSFTLTITPPLPCTPPPSGMVGWWPGDGTPNDIQNNNNGALQGGAAFATGRCDKAFSLNGSTGYVSIGNPAVLKIQPAITVDAWVKPASMPSSGALFAVATKWNQNTGKTPAGDAYGLFLINSGGTLQVFGVINPTGGAEMSVQGGAVLTNAFTHVAMTYDVNSGVLAVFVNGALVASRNDGGNNILASDVNVMIGRENDNIAPRFFPGLIDEVEIYERALSVAEFSAIYNAGANGKCKVTQCVSPPANLIGWWSGDNTTVDLQNGYTGALQNGATFAPGKVGQAFSFNGSVGCGIDVPQNAIWDFGADAFSIDAWVRLTTAPNQNPIVSHAEAPNKQWIFWFNNQNLEFFFFGASTNIQLRIPFIPIAGRWYHVAVTRNGSIFTFYVNGVAIGTQGTAAAIDAANAPLTIGRVANFGQFSLDGRIDELEIFHRALAAGEIQAIYNAGRAGKCKTPTFYVSNPGANNVEKFDAAGNDLGPFVSNIIQPTGLAFDASGNLFVALADNTIHKYDPAGNGTLFANSGLFNPYGLRLDANGNVYVANVGNNTIEKFTPAGSGSVFASSGLNVPVDLAFDDAGNVYVTNNNGNNVRKFDSAGSDLGVFASSGMANPAGLVFNTNGNLFVSSYGTGIITKFDSIGSLTPFASSLSGPRGMIFDPTGNLYVTTDTTHTIVKFDLAGTPSIFASNGLTSPFFIAMKTTSPLVPAAKITSVSRPANHFVITGRTLPNALVTIQAAPNLQSTFTTIGATTANGTGLFQYDDAGAVGLQMRFYRAIYP